MYPFQNYRIRFAAFPAIPIGFPVYSSSVAGVYGGAKRGGLDEDQDLQEIGEGSE
jgi:hypothetical protein